MSTPGKSITAYVASVVGSHVDPYLTLHQFSHGMVIFAIPDYGVLFKCRAEGKLIDLEFGAFFSLLKFVETSLASEKIGALTVFSSQPEFVFAFSGQSKHLTPVGERMRLLKERTARLNATVMYVESNRNAALWPASDYPAVPKGQIVKVTSALLDDSRRMFRPIQKGIRI